MTLRETENTHQNQFVHDPVEALTRYFVLPDQLEDSVQEPVSHDVASQERSQNRMNFQVGHIDLLCPENASREVVSPPSVNRLPNTASWFKGLANVRGGITPVVDLGEALGNKQTKQKYAYLLIFGRAEDSIGLLINEIPRTVFVSSNNKLSNLPALPRMLDGCVLAAYEQNHQIKLDLNIDKLFKKLADQLKDI